MLKLIAVLAVAVAANAVPNELNDLIVPAILRNRIEVYRRQMPHGINGGPSLAPYDVPNPILKRHNADQMGDDQHCYNITSMTIDGLDGFVISALAYDHGRMRLNYTVTYPLIAVRGEYKLKRPDSMMNRSGGNYLITFTDIENNIIINFDIQVYASSVESRSSVQRVKSNIDGMPVDGNLFWDDFSMLMDDYLDPVKPMMMETVQSWIDPLYA